MEDVILTFLGPFAFEQNLLALSRKWNSATFWRASRQHRLLQAALSHGSFHLSFSRLYWGGLSCRVSVGIFLALRKTDFIGRTNRLYCRHCERRLGLTILRYVDSARKTYFCASCLLKKLTAPQQTRARAIWSASCSLSLRAFFLRVSLPRSQAIAVLGIERFWMAFLTCCYCVSFSAEMLCSVAIFREPDDCYPLLRAADLPSLVVVCRERGIDGCSDSSRE